MMAALEGGHPLVVLCAGPRGVAPVRAALSWTPVLAHAGSCRVAVFYVAGSQSSAAYLLEWDTWREAGVSSRPGRSGCAAQSRRLDAPVAVAVGWRARRCRWPGCTWPAVLAVLHAALGPVPQQPHPCPTLCLAVPRSPSRHTCKPCTLKRMAAAMAARPPLSSCWRGWCLRARAA